MATSWQAEAAMDNGICPLSAIPILSSPAGLFVHFLSPSAQLIEELADGGCLLIALSDGRLDRYVFSNRRPGLRLESVLVKMKEDVELLVPSI
jgi:hypothetical protein